MPIKPKKSNSKKVAKKVATGLLIASAPLGLFSGSEAIANSIKTSRNNEYNRELLSTEISRTKNAIKKGESLKDYIKEPVNPGEHFTFEWRDGVFIGQTKISTDRKVMDLYKQNLIRFGDARIALKETISMLNATARNNDFYYFNGNYINKAEYSSVFNLANARFFAERVEPKDKQNILQIIDNINKKNTNSLPKGLFAKLFRNEKLTKTQKVTVNNSLAQIIEKTTPAEKEMLIKITQKYLRPEVVASLKKGEFGSEPGSPARIASTLLLVIGTGFSLGLLVRKYL